MIEQTETPPAGLALSLAPRHRAFIGMGGNLGDVARRFQQALSGLAALPATRVEAVSSLYRTKPIESSGPDYLNAVAVLQSALGPHELLRALLALELTHDRERPYQNAPRTLDLDLLRYGAFACNTRALTLPHPRMMQRAFVLVPLAQVWQGLEHADVEPALPSEADVAALALVQGIERAGSLGAA